MGVGFHRHFRIGIEFRSVLTMASQEKAEKTAPLVWDVICKKVRGEVSLEPLEWFECGPFHASTA